MVLDPLIGTIARLPSTPRGQSHDFSRRFAIGQTLKGMVLRAFPEGKTLVNFGGQHVLLEFDQPLIRGQTFLATVAQTSPTLVLKVIPDAAPESTDRGSLPTEAPILPNRGKPVPTPPGELDVTRFKSYLLVKQPFGDMVAALQNHLVQNPRLRALAPALMQRLDTTLAALLPETESPPDAARLQAQVDRSGLNYEAKVQQVLMRHADATEQAVLTDDLKGQLLDLLQRLDSASRTSPGSPPGELAELRQQALQALQNIEYHQLSNLFAQQENQSLLLQFLHPAFPASHTARLYFRAHQRQNDAAPDDPEEYTVVFLLGFTALGNVRIDATVRGVSVDATIRTEDQTVADFIAARTPSLTARLHDLGLRAQVRCRAQEKVPLEIDDTLTRLLIKDPSRLLDIMA